MPTATADGTWSGQEEARSEHVLTAGRRAVTVLRMTRGRSLFASLVVAALLSLWGAALPAAAHDIAETGLEGLTTAIAAHAPADPVDHRPGLLVAAPAPPQVTWPLLGVAGIVAFVWRRRRSSIALALALLLAIFAFEDGLHSVHHGFDKFHSASCPTAHASAHLSATGIEPVLSCDVILSVVAIATEPSQPILYTRPTGPYRGRAPPLFLL
jgi:hypothetical protein